MPEPGRYDVGRRLTDAEIGEDLKLIMASADRFARNWLYEALDHIAGGSFDRVTKGAAQRLMAIFQPIADSREASDPAPPGAPRGA